MMNSTIQKLSLNSPSNSPESSCLQLIQSSTDDTSIEIADIVQHDDMIQPTKPFDITMTRTEYYSSTSEAIYETTDDEILTTLDLLLSFSEIDEDIIFQNNGYEKVDKICDTLQGELFKAITLDTRSTKKQQYVAIKKTDKTLFNKRVAIEGDINFCVSENIIKESLILQYLTVDNSPIGNYIVKYIDLFESDTDYYLVMEYIESQMNLRQFVSVCHEYIENGKLSMKQYQKVIKYLLWQLFTTVQWLHITMHCCHLDVCMENIMLTNASFTKTKNGVSIASNISIKLCDFGVSEVFHNQMSKTSDITKNSLFLCEKQGLSLENELYFSPNVFNGSVYDGRCADNWSLGMMLFECITGKQLYEAMDVNIESIQSGYWSLHNNKLKKYLQRNNLLQYFNPNSFDLLSGLLNVDEDQRLYGMNILTHKWFKMYFQRYSRQISNKFRQSNNLNIRKYDGFPFYH